EQVSTRHDPTFQLVFAVPHNPAGLEREELRVQGTAVQDDLVRLEAVGLGRQAHGPSLWMNDLGLGLANRTGGWLGARVLPSPYAAVSLSQRTIGPDAYRHKRNSIGPLLNSSRTHLGSLVQPLAVT